MSEQNGRTEIWTRLEREEGERGGEEVEWEATLNSSLVSHCSSFSLSFGKSR